MDSVDVTQTGPAALQRLNDDVHAWARVLWDFHAGPPPAPDAADGGRDILLALGSHDLRVAAHAAALWHAGAAPLVVFSGDRGRRTSGGDGYARWQRREAEVFADASGLPDEAVILETRATNTGENFSLARRLCAEHGIEVRRAIATAKPYMARRAVAAAGVNWPGVEWEFRAFAGGYEGYPDDNYSAEELVGFLVGDLQRLSVYPRRGWSAAVDLPGDVVDAYERLVEAGFTEHLIPDVPPGLR